MFDVLLNNFVWFIVITMAFLLFTASRSGPFPGKENTRVENVQRSCKNPQGQEDGCHSCVWNSGKQTERNFATFGCRKNSTWINLLAFQAYGIFIPLKKSVCDGCNVLEAGLRNSRNFATPPLVSPRNRPFYRYDGHIEFIRFKEYYGMPREHLLSIYARFFG